MKYARSRSWKIRKVQYAGYKLEYYLDHFGARGGFWEWTVLGITDRSIYADPVDGGTAETEEEAIQQMQACIVEE